MAEAGIGLLDSISEFCRQAGMAESTFGRHAVNEVCGNYPPANAAARLPIAKTFRTVQDFVKVTQENTGPRVRVQ